MKTNTWEHWCHCHEMFLTLHCDEKCNDCDHDQQEYAKKVDIYLDSVFTFSPLSVKVEKSQ